LRPILSYLPLLLFSKLLVEIEKQHPKQSFLHLHPAFWDELQKMPWGGLRDYLLLTMERFPAIGKHALEYLTGGSQQWAVQSTRLELIARAMGNCRDIVSISNFSRQINLFTQFAPELQLQSFLEISRDVDMALRNTTEFHSRYILGQTRLRLKQLEDELRNTAHPYAERFAILAHRWLRILNTYLDDLSLNRPQQSIINPYICGTPLQGDQKMFVGRGDIISRIEQLLLDPRHPPILLYGQRRMGKTSLLLNLGNVLPSQIVPCFVDCQGLSGSSDYAELFYRMGEQMHVSAKRQTGFLLPSMQLKDMESRPFYQMNVWLNQTEELLEKQNKFLLIKLDEFELVSNLLRNTGMEERPFLDLLRHTIQHRPRFKLLFACSHDLSELRNLASYLINTQVIKLSYLEIGEAHQLIQYPLPGFPLRYDPLALNHMIQLTRGHPQLVQLMCYELVTLKNEQPAAQRYLAILDDVEIAAKRSLETGSFFFADIEAGQTPPSAKPMLTYLARLGAGQTLDAPTWRAACPQQFEENLQICLRRDLIEVRNGAYCFQIELVRRWFAQAQP
jgi:AAA+ ATPase superfamily predicted ATPase